MTWFDVVAVLLVVAIAWLESQRGFGRSLFDLLGGIISLKVSSLLSGSIADAAPVFATAETSQAFWLVVLFVVLAALTVIASHFVCGSILISLDVLDPLVGAILGIASGVVVAHIFLKMLLLTYTGTEGADVLLNSFTGQEFVKFRSYHTVITALENLGNW